MFDMRKFFLLFVLLLICFNCFYVKDYIENVSAENTCFARILKEDVKFYKEPIESEDFSNVLFELPKTYFVELIEQTNNIFFKAKYIDKIGYVKKIDIQFIKGVPLNPFADKVGFRIYALNGLNLRLEPSQKGGLFSVVTTIPFLSTDVQYYGMIQGEEAIQYKGSTWYFCKYINNNEKYFGYVYSPFCDQLSEIKTNNEVFEYIDKPEFSLEKEEENKTEKEEKVDFSSFSPLKQGLIISAVCLPCIFILYLLFKPTKITRNAVGVETRKTKFRKIKRKRGQDYYEYE